jgi:hypothetical protein
MTLSGQLVPICRRRKQFVPDRPLREMENLGRASMALKSRDWEGTSRLNFRLIRMVSRGICDRRMHGRCR